MVEEILDKIQTGLLIAIRVTGVASLVQKLNVGSILKYNSQPTFTDNLDMPSIGFFGGTTLTFLSTGAWPYVVPTFGASYPLYGTKPTILVRELVSAGVYKWRTDIQPVYDSTADTLTIDVVPFDGDITIKI